MTSITYQDFLHLADSSFAEWVEGKIVSMSPASLKHTEISVFLTRILAEYAEMYDLGRVLNAPFQMRLSVSDRGREPDILFVAKTHIGRLTPTYLNGAADLAVEIVSPESRVRDRQEKFAEYEQEGIREYWVIDPDEYKADFFVLHRKKYQQKLPDKKGIYRSTVLNGFWLDVNWLWQKELPRVRTVLKEWEKSL